VTTIGTIESLWRYPVKGMRGETVNEAFVGFSGVFGDRGYAIKSSAARKGFPYLNPNAQPQMLLYQPTFRYPERAAKPPNMIEAMNIAPGVNPTNAEPEDLMVDVVTPSGEVVAIDDPALLEMLGEGLPGDNQLKLLRSDRALVDCRPISLISLQTLSQIAKELELPIDKRRFRANIYFNLNSNEGFAEDRLVGGKLRLGSQVVIAILERDPRCKMISLDPETGEHNPEVLRKVAQGHDACAGLYCAVLVEGVVTVGDSIEVVDNLQPMSA
jgi:uncharacterized protein YcbX